MIKFQDPSDRKSTRKDAKSPDPVNCHGMEAPTKSAFPTNLGKNYSKVSG